MLRYLLLVILFATGIFTGRAVFASESRAPALPSLLPANGDALFDNGHYFYQGEGNNPRLHPVPPEYQSGPRRDWHIHCLDWYRYPRTGRKSKWAYDKTTCECWSNVGAARGRDEGP